MTGQILEVKGEMDPMLEVSHLTDDSKLNDVLGEKGDTAVQEMSLPSMNQTQESLFETPKKNRMNRSQVTTPDTAPMDDDDGVSDGSKYRRHSESSLTIRVDDYKVVTFEKLIRRLEGNSDLETLEIYRQRIISNKRVRTYDEISHFFAMLRRLPNLKTLVLTNFSRQDIGPIIFMVKGHPTLERFHVHLTSSTVESSLLDILAEAPALKEVSLDVQASFPLHLLVASRTLTRITVPSETFQFEERHLVFAMNALEKNQTLQILDLKPKLTASDVRLLAFGIRDNSCLQVLRFSFLADEGEAGAALVHLCGSLSRNSALRTVENYYAKLLNLKPGDAYRIQTSKNSLKTLQIFREQKGQADCNDQPLDDHDDFMAKLMCHSDVSFSHLSDQALRCFRPTDGAPLSPGPCRTIRTNKYVSVVTETTARIRSSFLQWKGSH